MSALPRHVNWHLTYACQLRCTHCYTESGRRAAQKLPRDRILAVADVLVSMKPESVCLGGGEPLLVPELFEINDRLRAAGITTRLYTNGFQVSDDVAADLGRRFDYVHVSIDGATAEVHDTIRGRAGSFDDAMRTLAALDRAAQQDPNIRFGIEVSLLRSNFAQMELFCTSIPARFPEIDFVGMAAANPTGLASRESYVEAELLGDAELAVLRDAGLQARLRALTPASVETVYAVDGFFLLPTSAERRKERNPFWLSAMEIEADGGVRGVLTSEGVVGNILEEAPATLWTRVQERLQDPFVVAALEGVGSSMKAWAEATRRIDRHFGRPADLRRIARRPAHDPERQSRLPVKPTGT
jgi:MoaA/NifB/PqqE/SkfB family radical SAM enzyme